MEDEIMDAPLYPPAQAYVAPERFPRQLDTRDVSIAELLAIPAARAVIMKELPLIQQVIGMPQLKPHLSNFSIRDLVQFGIVKEDALARTDAELAKLGTVR
jgi:hypothetical protein